MVCKWRGVTPPPSQNKLALIQINALPMKRWKKSPQSKQKNPIEPEKAAGEPERVAAEPNND